MDEFAMRALEHLKKLVSIPSASGNENEVAEYCYRTVEAAGFRAEKIPTDDGRFVVYAEMQGGRPGKTLLFSGHIDTVPVVGGWDTDPHTAVLKTVGGEERLYGLGASDMKSGIALMLALAEYMGGKGPDAFSGVLSMAFLPDEEAYSAGARTLIKHGVKADVSVMTEPGFGQIYVGGPGKMLVKAVAKGKACHGARPEEGINAVVELAKLIAVLDKIPLKDDGEMGPQQYVPFSIKGGPDHYSLSVPQDCCCFISKQLVPGETKEEVFANLEEAVRGLNIQGSITFELSKPFYMPYRVDETSADFKLFEEVCQKELGCVPPYAIEPSVSDSNCLSGEAGIPVIMFGADGHGNHQANEYVVVSSIDAVGRVYRGFTHSYLA